MPLTPSQEEFIKALVDFQLDFSDELDGFQTQIDQLTLAFNSAVDDRNEFYTLRTYFFTSTTTLQGLEKHNAAKVKISEVQLFLAQYLTTCIGTHAGQLKINTEDLSWDLTKINAQIPAENYNLDFATVISAPSETFAWQNIHDEGNIYWATLELNENHITVDLKVSIAFPDKVDLPTLPEGIEFLDSTDEFITTVRNFKEMPEDDDDQEEDQDEFETLESFIPDAKTHAEKLAKNLVLYRLFKEDLIDQENKVLAPHHSKIITTLYYLKLILEKELLFPKIEALTKEEVVTLTDPTVIDLQKNKLCSFKRAKSLTPLEIMLAAKYHSAISDGRISIKDLIGVTQAQSRILFVPLIMNLIKQGRLNISTAKELPLHLKPLLQSGLYMDYLSSKAIAWIKMRDLQKSHCTFLLTAPVALLIKNDIFSITDIPLMEPELFVSVCRPTLHALLLNKTIDINNIRSFTIAAISLLDSHPHLAEWLKHKIIDPNYIKIDKLTLLYTRVYSRRLTALCQIPPTPYSLHGVKDDTDWIAKEIPLSATHANMAVTELQEKIVKHFIKSLRDIIKSILNSKPPYYEKKMFCQLLQKIESPEIQKKGWFSVMHELIEEAESILENKLLKNLCKVFEKTKKESTLFAASSNAHLKPFCQNLISFRVLLPTQKATKHLQLPSPTKHLSSGAQNK